MRSGPYACACGVCKSTPVDNTVLRGQYTAVSAAPRVQNPYFEEYKRLNPTLKDPLLDIGSHSFQLYEKLYVAREDLVKRYAWAIPDKKALDLIAKQGPLVEMGAGTGYWASLLRAMGVDIVAYDRAPPGHGPVTRNKWHDPVQYTHVTEGGPEVLWAHPDRALFLCWPPYADPFALDCANLWGGNTLVFVGELGGCTGCDRFYESLRGSFVRWAYHDIPTWPGLRDFLSVWKRRSTLGTGEVPEDE